MPVSHVIEDSAHEKSLGCFGHMTRTHEYHWFRCFYRNIYADVNSQGKYEYFQPFLM